MRRAIATTTGAVGGLVLLILAARWAFTAPDVDVITACVSVLVLAAFAGTVIVITNRDSDRDTGDTSAAEYLRPLLRGAGRTGNRLAHDLARHGFLFPVTAKTLAARSLARARDAARHPAPPPVIAARARALAAKLRRGPEGRHAVKTAPLPAPALAADTRTWRAAHLVRKIRDLGQPEVTP